MDVMIDLETWGVGPDAVIAQIGWAQFDPFTTGIRDFGTIFVDPQSSIDAGLTVSASTIRWWLEQETVARAAMIGNELEVPLDSALAKIESRLNILQSFAEREAGNIWANPVQFDLAILASAFIAVGKAVPWHHQRTRDARTLIAVTGYDRSTGPQPQVAHVAGYDASAQAKQVQEAFRLISGAALVAEAATQPVGPTVKEAFPTPSA